MLTSGIILAKMNHQLFTQTYINILTPFTNLVHCPQIHLPISKVVDKILAAVNHGSIFRQEMDTFFSNLKRNCGFSKTVGTLKVLLCSFF